MGRRLQRHHSEWRVENSTFSLEVGIPDGTNASVTLPDGTTTEVGRGIHSFTCNAPRKDHP